MKGGWELGTSFAGVGIYIPLGTLLIFYLVVTKFLLRFNRKECPSLRIGALLRVLLITYSRGDGDLIF